MANEPTIEQKNREIFDFMGFKHSEHKDIDEWEMKTLKYHEDWNQLMRVVERIETPELYEKGRWIVRSAVDVKILYKACVITHEPDEESGDTNEAKGIAESGETKLEGVYKAVYQFIQWLNQQKLTDDTER